MEALEKKMLKTIAKNLQNSTKWVSGESWEKMAVRMKQTITEAMPMFDTLIDEPEEIDKGPVKL